MIIQEFIRLLEKGEGTRLTTSQLLALGGNGEGYIKKTRYGDTATVIHYRSGTIEIQLPFNQERNQEIDSLIKAQFLDHATTTPLKMEAYQFSEENYQGIVFMNEQGGCCVQISEVCPA